MKLVKTKPKQSIMKQNETKNTKFIIKYRNEALKTKRRQNVPNLQ